MLRFVLLLVSLCILSSCGTTKRAGPPTEIEQETRVAALFTHKIPDYCGWRDWGGPFEKGGRTQICRANLIFSDNSDGIRIQRLVLPFIYEREANGEWRPLDRSEWVGQPNSKYARYEDVVYEAIFPWVNIAEIEDPSFAGPNSKYVPKGDAGKGWFGPIAISKGGLHAWMRSLDASINSAGSHQYEVGIYDGRQQVGSTTIGKGDDDFPTEAYFSRDEAVLVIQQSENDVHIWDIPEDKVSTKDCAEFDLSRRPLTRWTRWSCAMAAVDVECGSCQTSGWQIEKIRTSADDLWLILEHSERDGGYIRRARIYDQSSRKTLSTFPLENSKPGIRRSTDIAISPDGSYWAYASSTGILRIFELNAPRKN